MSFRSKLESVQYNAALAITGCIRGTSRERLYEELGLESLDRRRWYRRMCLYWKITLKALRLIIFVISYLYYNTCGIPIDKIVTLVFQKILIFFANSFFPYCTDQWNELDLNY